MAPKRRRKRARSDSDDEEEYDKFDDNRSLQELALRPPGVERRRAGVSVEALQMQTGKDDFCWLFLFFCLLQSSDDSGKH
jgi:hypothetical protein